MQWRYSIIFPKEKVKPAFAIMYDIGVGTVDGRDGGRTFESSSKSSSYRLLGISVSQSPTLIMLGRPI